MTDESTRCDQTSDDGTGALPANDACSPSREPRTLLPALQPCSSPRPLPSMSVPPPTAELWQRMEQLSARVQGLAAEGRRHGLTAQHTEELRRHGTELYCRSIFIARSQQTAPLTIPRVDAPLPTYRSVVPILPRGQEQQRCAPFIWISYGAVEKTIKKRHRKRSAPAALVKGASSRVAA